jgi:hypothetical protein
MLFPKNNSRKTLVHLKISFLAAAAFEIKYCAREMRSLYEFSIVDTNKENIVNIK